MSSEFQWCKFMKSLAKHNGLSPSQTEMRQVACTWALAITQQFIPHDLYMCHDPWSRQVKTWYMCLVIDTIVGILLYSEYVNRYCIIIYNPYCQLLSDTHPPMWVRSPTLDHGTYIVTSPCMAYALRPRIHLGHFWNLDTFISPNLSVGPLVWDHEGWLRHKRQRHNVLIAWAVKADGRVLIKSHFDRTWLELDNSMLTSAKCVAKTLSALRASLPFEGAASLWAFMRKSNPLHARNGCKVHSTSFNSLCKDAKFITNVKVPDSVWAFHIKNPKCTRKNMKELRSYSDSTLFYRTCTAPWRVVADSQI